MNCALSLGTDAAIACLCCFFPSLAPKDKNKPRRLPGYIKLAFHDLMLLIYCRVFRCKLGGYVMETMSWVFRKLM